MLSAADAQVVERDPHIPGLATLLDASTFAETLSRAYPEAGIGMAIPGGRVIVTGRAGGKSAAAIIGAPRESVFAISPDGRGAQRPQPRHGLGRLAAIGDDIAGADHTPGVETSCRGQRPQRRQGMGVGDNPAER